MLLNLTELSSEPVHSQISRQIVEKVVAGDITEGDELLPLRTVARTHHISPMIVERAYTDLEEKGVIVRHHGSGYVVSPLSEEAKQNLVRQTMSGVNLSLDAIDVFSGKLSSVFDPVKLRGLLEEYLKNYFNVDQLFFAMPDAGTQLNEYIQLTSGDDFTTFDFPADDTLYRTICQLSLPAFLKDLAKNGAKKGLYYELAKRNVQVVYPMKYTDTEFGFIALPEKNTGALFLNEDLGVLTVMVNQFVTALTTSKYYTEAVEKRRLEEEMRFAKQIQQDLLPSDLPDNEHFQIAGYSQPSLTVGGDFYDFLPIDEDRFGVVIADACGKGMPAAMLISQVQAMVKSESHNGNSIEKTMVNLNIHIKQYTSAQNFITLFYGIYDRTSGVFEYANAGHNFPVLLRKEGGIEMLPSTGPALGIMPHCNYVTGQVKIGAGDCLTLYSDGVTETMDESKEEFGEERLKDSIIRSKECSAKDMIGNIVKDVRKFDASDTQDDDRTLMIIKVK